ncbi:MAG: chemotaxis protein CheA [Acidobacteriota bacterium]
MDTRDFLDLFLSESREHLEGMNSLLLKARRGSLDREEINDLFRHAHSLKGMAASMGYAALAALAHSVEDLFHRWRDGGAPPGAESLDLLLRATDRLAEQVDAVAGGSEPAGDDRLIEALRSLDAAGPGPRPPDAAGGDAAAAPEEEADPRPRVAVEIALRPDAALPAARALVVLQRLAEHGRVLESVPPPADMAEGRFSGPLRVTLATAVAGDRLASILLEVPDVDECRIAAGDGEERRRSRRRLVPDRRAEPGPDPPPEGAPHGPGRIGTIRVATERLDRLLDGVGELILDRERLKLVLRPDPRSPEAAILEGLGRAIDALRDEVMTMRLIPFAALEPRLQRAVRDLARRLEKDVDLAVEGTDVSLDRLILEEMMDPLEHLLRNSIDHGIESPEARRAAGKPPAGRITVGLSRHEDRVVLSLSDDGRGIDPAALRRTAADRRFITREAAEVLSDEEAYQLITLPGFSTAARTTDISGRGVGMDVVQTRLRKLGGSLNVRSTVGVGTRFELNLPLTVTVTRAFLCRAAGEVYAVPVSQVLSTVHVDRGRLQGSRGERILRREEEVLTVLPLAGLLLDDRRAAFPADFPALICRAGARAFALAVDEILGEQEIVIKPLKHPLEMMPHYAGAAILNDGRIALILDPANLTHLSRAA